MAEKLQRLRGLQDIDTLLDRVAQRLQSLDNEAQREEEKVRLAKAQLKTQEEDTLATRKKIDGQELELKTKDAAIAKLMVQLNSVKTNKEYQAFQHEIATIKTAASLIEDESLKMMEEMEQAQRKQAKAQANLKIADDELAAKKKESNARRKQLEDEQVRLRAKREEAAAALEHAHREAYERLRNKVDGKAVVGARKGACEGCYMDLTSNTINHLMGGDEIIRCHSCGRILYLIQDSPDEDEEEDE
jgi:uncharacterized protein